MILAPHRIAGNHQVIIHRRANATTPASFQVVDNRQPLTSAMKGMADISPASLGAGLSNSLTMVRKETRVLCVVPLRHHQGTATPSMEMGQIRPNTNASMIALAFPLTG
jgi:hypothetical protein